jgi:hypothetical protein
LTLAIQAARKWAAVCLIRRDRKLLNHKKASATLEMERRRRRQSERRNWVCNLNATRESSVTSRATPTSIEMGVPNLVCGYEDLEQS